MPGASWLRCDSCGKRFGGVERSGGVAVKVGSIGAIVGGGGSGIGALDAEIERAAELLSARFEHPVTIRFNSNRESGGAWLKTHSRDAVGLNSDIGVTGEIITQRRVDVIEEWRERYNEDWYPNIPPVGTVVILAYLSARAILPRYSDLLYEDRAMLAVPSTEDALTLLSASADPSRLED